eukprot:TRINITY_DN9683_c0_g1_i1.p1 TRINITY_DN9683_c0_g1~~TRINITY_DN9683_c0_g1_i1.p1  ORF type:complete len:424 (+),score=93.52 TRINITY_DN9683_c0_g1_i1:120-1274(+)
MAIFACETEAVAAGVFTTSVVRAAPVDYCRAVLERSETARAIVVNSGQANAATGVQGERDTAATAAAFQAALQTTGEVLVCSTGVIGQRVKMDPLLVGVPHLVAKMGGSRDSGHEAAVAIMTTDLVFKEHAVEGQVDGHTVRVGGCAKGAGMIHPNMATMLSFVSCDAAVDAKVWRQLVREAADQSFNQITVDGDTSTNDSLIALASGRAGNPRITDPDSPAAWQLRALLFAVTAHLAKSIARDGEGATVLLEVAVTSAQSDADARRVARTVCSSHLFKAAVFGRDPNWGRIAAAAGRAGVAFDQSRLSIRLGSIQLLENGAPCAFDAQAAHQYMVDASKGGYLTSDTVRVEIDLGVAGGAGTGVGWGCDLSYDYVKINAESTT